MSTLVAKAADAATVGGMESTTKRTRKSGASVYATLREEILNLDIKPSTPLDETELGRRFGVSRSPVREALARLSSEGLVRSLANRSSIVSSFDLADVIGYIAALDLLYRAAARQAAVMAGPDDIVDIEAAAQAHADASAAYDAPAVVRHNRAFHIAIARASGNPWFVGWTEQLLDTGQRIMRLYVRHFSHEPAQAFLGTHGSIVDAIRAGDPDGAEVAAGQDAAYLMERLRPVITGERGGRAAAAPSWETQR